jgi:hypothetical protein
MKSTGHILVLSYPDTFVKMSEELICRFLPWFGIGTKEYIKAGHAALVLISNETGQAQYFDFGRYITPFGYGRVRSERTDAELKIPFKARFTNDGRLINMEEFLLWLEAHPDKTHGHGRLIASLCSSINFDRAEQFILRMQGKGSIPYGAFGSNSSNCSRFVADVLVYATTNRTISRKLRWNKLFTPSAIGNVEKSSEHDLYEVLDGTVKPYMGSAFKENLKNYFDKRRPQDSDSIKQIDDLEGIQKLCGTGSSAWFELIDEYLSENQYRIRRYNDRYQLDFDGIYQAVDHFNPLEDYEFTYDSHCLHCHIKQGSKRIRFNYIKPFEEISSERKVHSA